MLLDLSFANRIDTDPENLKVIDRTPTGNLVLDRVLAKIEVRQEAADVGGWTRLLSVEDADIIREQALVRLVRRGIVSLRSSQFNWVFRPGAIPQ